MTVRLRFTKDRGFNAVIVRAYTWCEFDHCEIVTSDGYYGARPDGGVKMRPFDYADPYRQLFVRIDYDIDDTSRFLAAAFSQQDKPYDWSAIYGLGLHRDWRNEGQWVCSELDAWCSLKTKRPLVGSIVELNRISPRDLLLSPELIVERII